MSSLVKNKLIGRDSVLVALSDLNIVDTDRGMQDKFPFLPF